jgi:hypothetical protein
MSDERVEGMKLVYILGDAPEDAPYVQDSAGQEKIDDFQPKVRAITTPYYEAFLRKAEERIHLGRDRKDHTFGNRRIAIWDHEGDVGYRQKLTLRYFREKKRGIILSDFSMNISPRDSFWTRDHLDLDFSDNSISRVFLNVAPGGKSVNYPFESGITSEESGVGKFLNEFCLPGGTQLEQVRYTFDLETGKRPKIRTGMVMLFKSGGSYDFTDFSVNASYNYDISRGELVRYASPVDKRKSEKYKFPQPPSVTSERYLALLEDLLGFIPSTQRIVHRD